MKLRSIAIVIFWLVMTGWLVRYEAFPEWFSTPGFGYQALLQDGPFIVDSWMQVLFKETPIGYSHTWVDSRVESPEESYMVNNVTFLNLKMMGLTQWVKVSAGATLDARYRLQKFFAVMNSSVYTTRLDGERSGAAAFRARVRTAGGEQTLQLTIPDDVILYSPMTEMAMRRLQPGQSLQLRTFDPLSMTTSDLSVQALRREPFQLDGQDRETTVLKLVYQGLETLSWIDAEGRILRQETPFGWTLQACSPEKAMAFKQDAAQAEDMLLSLAVPCRGFLANPRDCRKIQLVLYGAGLDPQAMAGPRQKIDLQGTNSLHVTLLAQLPPVHRQPLGPVPGEYRPWLNPSAFIQSGHPDLVRQAKTVIGNRTDSWDAATAIYAWVYRNVKKQSAISLPSALDVLQKMEGDCNEHTYLFVALARAAGLPARIHVGLVYAEMPGRPEGAFYYHAWPSVYVGAWVEMDPTLGQVTVDATHISLMTGELADQIKLLGLLGRARVDIVAEE
ncbi:MAG: transglutaminase-like domain-containing protein [Verrucomicrobia bacterium]|nr:transglutaminase-like domain-containing protein [Verrucomicrobiota bacterium]MCG2681827.1 transglutaminase-like domain-containing protein [Kiritimatiellia bacterium]MBU4247709.1 transglutaminase-like domain-containing protein [Verrucomicrobiota bacterium]MBU4291640.1 transglutaminase-like domain-containing protein [Verrucomicrobiota bacterium]MBU4429543.1 transglutaminase-like domain-containing protein [Verrucomicrobiota bacterium]